MLITLRGVRGSIPVPGPDTVKYGGNTTCISITTDEGDQIIIDGGTGIREYGMAQMAKLPLTVHIFLTHTHWDHIQGFPFYVPLFVPGNTIHFYGSFDPVYHKDLQTILSQQMEYCYFPVRESELNATIHYHRVQEHQPVTIGSAVVTPILLNHPVLNHGYRIESHGKSFFFTGDYEPASNIYSQEDEEFEQYEDLIKDQNKSVVDFIRGVDVAVLDSQYTPEEYATKVGWGHGTYQSSIALASDAQVSQVYFTHHDPMRTDAQLDAIFEQLQTSVTLPSGLSMAMAREGIEIQL